MEYGSVICRNFEQLQAGLSHSMDSSGTRTCSNSVSIIIAVQSSAKDIILRRSQPNVVCLEAHALTSSTTSQISPGMRWVAIGSHFILKVVRLKINIFTEILCGYAGHIPIYVHVILFTIN